MRTFLTEVSTLRAELTAAQQAFAAAARAPAPPPQIPTYVPQYVQAPPVYGNSSTGTTWIWTIVWMPKQS
jgi:hypothetical protein